MKTKIIITLALTLTALATANFLQRNDETMFKFMNFIRQHNKAYSSTEEFQLRFRIFSDNLVKTGPVQSFSPFFDQSEEEFRSRLTLNAALIPQARASAETYVSKISSSELPASFDWRDKGVVNPVKDQGQCGSCWAFSAIANIEGQYAKSHGTLEAFSEQQLVDCDRTYDQGCNGGLMDYAFQYFETHGVMRQTDYPYTARDGTCKYKKAKGVVQAKSFLDIGQNEEEIRKVLFETGPLSIAVDATSFQFYDKGIVSDCIFGGLNHGVTLVGYGEENGTQFWTVRNSWGQSWGEEGYIRLVRGTAQCGLNSNVSTVQLK